VGAAAAGGETTPLSHGSRQKGGENGRGLARPNVSAERGGVATAVSAATRTLPRGVCYMAGITRACDVGVEEGALSRRLGRLKKREGGWRRKRRKTWRKLGNVVSARGAGARTLLRGVRLLG